MVTKGDKRDKKKIRQRNRLKPRNTSLLKRIMNAMDPKDQEKDVKSIFSQKRALKDYVAPFSRRYKLKGLVKGKFEAKLHAINFLLGQSEIDLNETTDTDISSLTTLLILMFKKGRASKK